MVQQLFDLGNGFVVRLDILSDRLRLYARSEGGDGRFLEIANGGGHIECLKMKSLPEGTGLEIGEDGYPVIHES